MNINIKNTNCRKSFSSSLPLLLERAGVRLGSSHPSPFGEGQGVRLGVRGGSSSLRSMKQSLLLALAFCFFALLSNAQTINSIASTESRCSASGTLTVNASGGTAPLSYQITAGPSTTLAQSSNVFTALAAGTYTIKVTDAVGGTATQTATVAGTFTPMVITNIPTSPYCVGGSNGKIVTTVTTGTGRAPFSFQMLPTLGATI